MRKLEEEEDELKEDIRSSLELRYIYFCCRWSDKCGAASSWQGPTGTDRGTPETLRRQQRGGGRLNSGGVWGRRRTAAAAAAAAGKGTQSAASDRLKTCQKYISTHIVLHTIPRLDSGPADAAAGSGPAAAGRDPGGAAGDAANLVRRRPQPGGWRAVHHVDPGPAGAAALRQCRIRKEGQLSGSDST